MRSDAIKGPARDVGAEIRAARTSRGWSMRRLASRIGTSQPFVSKIENGQVFPSLRTLHLIAGALGVPLARLLPRGAGAPVIAAREDMRRAAGEAPARRVVEGLGLQAYRVELTAGESEPRPHLHPGEEFVLVLEGVARVLREGHPALVLASGESVWIDGAVPHRLSADVGAVALVTIARADTGRAHG